VYRDLLRKTVGCEIKNNCAWKKRNLFFKILYTYVKEKPYLVFLSTTFSDIMGVKNELFLIQEEHIYSSNIFRSVYMYRQSLV